MKLRLALINVAISSRASSFEGEHTIPIVAQWVRAGVGMRSIATRLSILLLTRMQGLANFANNRVGDSRGRHLWATLPGDGSRECALTRAPGTDRERSERDLLSMRQRRLDVGSWTATGCVRLPDRRLPPVSRQIQCV